MKNSASVATSSRPTVWRRAMKLSRLELSAIVGGLRMPYVSNREPYHSLFKSVIEVVVLPRGLHRDVECWCKHRFDRPKEYMNILTGVGSVLIKK